MNPYGCAHCGGPVGARRLADVPAGEVWALVCADCDTQVDTVVIGGDQ